MRLAVAGWLLTGAIALMSAMGVAYARPPSMHGYIFDSGPYPVHHKGKSEQRPRRGVNDEARRLNRNPRNQQDPPGDPRFYGHMSPQDRQLLRQHIEDAVKELYTR